MVLIELEKTPQGATILFETDTLDKPDYAGTKKTLRQILKEDKDGSKTGWTKKHKNKLKEHGEDVE